MLFNSIPFIFVFIPIVITVYFLTGYLQPYLTAAASYVVKIISSATIALYRFVRSGGLSLGCLWLCAASVFFYAYWDSTYLWLLFASIVLNYISGCWIIWETSRKSRNSFYVLVLAVCSNLAVLGYYKYSAFFVASVTHLLGNDFAMGKIVLPLGISFFTFTQIAFLVDAYRGKAKEYNFFHYLLFVTYFPHLIAGPILHHAQMMPQFKKASNFNINWENFVIGIQFFIIGLVKKVLIADTCAGFSTPVFEAAKLGTPIPFIDSWLGAYAYTLQLYFDFSAYCDMAIGVSYFFNIRLPYNFHSPYKATNIIDFWRRWHITLSTFLRDYLYIPLGGNRQGPIRRYVNLFVTMLLGGLWHGAGWTFVLWGSLHGIYLIINHSFHAFRKSIGWNEGRFGWPERAISVVITFIAVMLGWVLFRSDNLLAAQTMFTSMFGGNGFALTPKLVYYCKLHLHPLLIPGLIMIWALPNTQEWVGVKDHSDTETGTLPGVPAWWKCLFLGIALAVCILFLILSQLRGEYSEFLYFQF